MTLAVALFGIAVALLGIVGMLSPAQLLAAVTRLQSRLGLAGIALLRLGLGVALLLAADGSRAPLYLQVVGVLSLVSGGVTPFVGIARFEKALDWWRARPPGFVRSWSFFVLVFGASLLWAVFPVLRGDA